MEVKDKKEPYLYTSLRTLAGFELTRSQTSLFLILSLVGIFMVPFTLAGDIFLNLFQFLFSILPDYLIDSSYRPEDYLVYTFFPILIRLIISTIYLLLSIYALRKILTHKNTEHKVKRNFIPQDRTVNWLGLRISHGPSLFIFSASVVGIILLVQLFLESIFSHSIFDHGLFDSLCWIPEGPNQATSHEILLNDVPLALMATFFLLCLYSLFIVRRGKPMIPSKKNTSNYSLLIFIASIVVLILLSARIFCHLALFNYEVASLLGISSNAPNPYQNEDFIYTISLICICLVLMISSFFLKDKTTKESKTSDDLTWLHVKLNPHRAVILLSVALLYIVFFTWLYLSFIIIMGSSFNFSILRFNLFDIIFFIIVLFCYYPIGKILKNNRFDNIIENIDNSREFKTNWFKFHLSKANSVIFLSVSSGLIGLFIYQLFIMNMSAQAFLQYPYPDYSYMLFSFPAMTAIISIILVVIVYTIKKTLPSIKSRE